MPLLVDHTKSYLYQLGAKEQAKELTKQFEEKLKEETIASIRATKKASIKAMKKAGISLESMLDFSNCKTMEELKAILTEIENEEK